jgi:SnoaL-like protein
MSLENVALAGKALDAFHRRDRAEFVALCAPDYEWVPPVDWPETAYIRGPEAVWAFMVELDEPWEPGEYEIAEVIDCDNDKVVMHLRGTFGGGPAGWKRTSTTGGGDRAEWEGCAHGMVRRAQAGARGRERRHVGHAFALRPDSSCACAGP